VPPITELTRIEPVYLGRLEKQGVFTTGILLEVTETPARRQYLADHVDADPNDVLAWRDEALMLNLAAFGPTEHRLMLQAGIDGINGILAVDLDTLKAKLARAATELNLPTPEDLTVEGWWEQARTLDDTVNPNRPDLPGLDVYGSLLRFALGAVVGGTGAVIGAIATGFASEALAIVFVGVVLLATGAIARWSSSSLAAFVGMLVVSGILLLVLAGRTVGIDSPLSIHAGMGLLVGMPALVAGYLLVLVVRRTAGAARPSGASKAAAGASR
jgi:hypothetical protein